MAAAAITNNSDYNKYTQVPLWKQMLENGYWRKGGYQTTGLRLAAQVQNRFPGAARQNLILNPDNYRKLDSIESNVISSIGQNRISPNKLVAGASTAGPGTLFSSNLDCRFPVIKNELQMGRVDYTGQKQQFVDYRSTDPTRVHNLRINPLSIFVTDEAVNNDIPAFMTDVRPDNYATYKNVHSLPVNATTIKEAIDGDPQINILGLTKSNPFLGLRSVPNTEPEFLGKTYGGNDMASAKPYAEALYRTNYITNVTEQPIPSNKLTESNQCKNKALHHFTPGYNITQQINQDKYVQYPPLSKTSNLPWGPRRLTNNPQTAKGGIWKNDQS